MKTKKAIGILSADYHLSHKPPVWRSNEPDWYAAMQRPLDEIRELSDKYKCPVLCAGDIFDKWNSPPELINWVIQLLRKTGEPFGPTFYSIPGQHDIPNHNFDEIKRSAYETICKTAICDLPCGEGALENIASQEMTIWPFPFGFKIRPEKRETKFLKVALVHNYVWMPGHSYPNAPKEKQIPLYGKHNKNMVGDKYFGYDVIIYGDNHKGFQTQIGKTTIFNCGTLMRRKSDEENYRPMVGLLYSDGSVEPHYLDISKDKHLTAEEAKPREQVEELDMDELADELRKLGSSALDFADAVKQYCQSKGVDKPVQDIILKAMENKKK